MDRNNLITFIGDLETDKSNAIKYLISRGYKSIPILACSGIIDAYLKKDKSPPYGY